MPYLHPLQSDTEKNEFLAPDFPADSSQFFRVHGNAQTFCMDKCIFRKKTPVLQFGHTLEQNSSICPIISYLWMVGLVMRFFFLWGQPLKIIHKNSAKKGPAPWILFLTPAPRPLQVTFFLAGEAEHMWLYPFARTHAFSVKKYMFCNLGFTFMIDFLMPYIHRLIDQPPLNHNRQKLISCHCTSGNFLEKNSGPFLVWYFFPGPISCPGTLTHCLLDFCKKLIFNKCTEPPRKKKLVVQRRVSSIFYGKFSYANQWTFVPTVLQCLTLRCCIRSLEPPRIRHVMLLHVFCCTPTHTSCYVAMLRCYGFCGISKRPSWWWWWWWWWWWCCCCAPFCVGVRSSGRWCLYWLVPRCVDGFYTGLSPGVLTVLVWPAHKFAQAMSMFRNTFFFEGALFER